ncbi:MAG: DUF3043 domain-containing protein [Bifidobacteriaceae bacterium]|nr:DUF3043 domain-containing protein [Bifidobacteriaceae bacterium]
MPRKPELTEPDSSATTAGGKDRSARKKSKEPSAAESAAAKAGGKGRPTPSRKEAVAANKRPLGGYGQKKGPAAQALTKEQRREQRLKQRERFDYAMRTGDDRYLPARDKGPVRRWTRDYIDSRRSLGEYLVWLAIGSLLSLMVLVRVAPILASLLMLGMYILVFAFISDAIFRGRRLKKALVAKFGLDKLPPGSVWYGVNRSFQMRRSRMPNPQVQRGEYPEGGEPARMRRAAKKV